MDTGFWVDTRPPFLDADPAAVTLSTTAKALLPVAALPVLGGNYFGYRGKSVMLKLGGRITTAATPGNGTFQLLWGNGTDANGTVLAASAAHALTASQANLTWYIELLIECRALGASGALMVIGELGYNPGVVSSTLQPLMVPASAPAGVTVDLTQNFVLSPQYLRSGSTAETMQVHSSKFFSLN